MSGIVHFQFSASTSTKYPLTPIPGSAMNGIFLFHHAFLHVMWFHILFYLALMFYPVSVLL